MNLSIILTGALHHDSSFQFPEFDVMLCDVYSVGIVINNVLASLNKSVFNLFIILSNELVDPWLTKKTIWFCLQKHISRKVPCVVHQHNFEIVNSIFQQ